MNELNSKLSIIDQMLKYNGVAFDPGTNVVNLKESMKRWIAVYFNGNQYRFDDLVLNDQESKDLAIGLVHLLEKMDHDRAESKNK